MKKALIVFLAVLLAFGSIFALGSCTEEEITSVKIGYCNGLTPLSWMDSVGKAQGFDIDLAALVFKSLGITFEFVNYEEEKLPLALNGGMVDVIWSGFALDPSKTDWKYSNPYLKDFQVVVVRQDSGIKSLSDIPAGATVAVKNCEPSLRAMNENSALKSRISLVNDAYVTDDTVVRVETDADAIGMLRSSTCSVAVVSQLSEYYFEGLAENKGVFLQLAISEVSEDMVVVAKNEKLIEKINDTMSSLYTSTNNVEVLANKYNLVDFVCIPKNDQSEE